MRFPGVVAFVALIIGAGLPSAAARAHPGGLNAEGCHNNRRTGEYHCHRGGSAARNPSTSSRTFRAFSSGVAFRNCSEARAAGAAPVRAGDSGYSRKLDRDGDGVGCE